jgi:RNA polymerase sigma-B factor
MASTVTTPPAVAQRLLGEIEDRRDRLMAVLTVPVRSPRQWAAIGEPAEVPAVEAHVWLLHVRYARHRDTTSRDALVAEYESHARTLARRFYRHREPLDDLVQVALEALLVALDRFEPDRRMPFLGFANPTIIGSLKRYYRDAGWALRVPRRVHELTRPVREAAELLSQDFGRAPSLDEIADLLGTPVERVREAVDASTVRSLTSLDAPLPGDGTTTVGRQLGDEDPLLRLVENREALRQSLELLDDAERVLLDRYFGDGLTQVQIAELMNVSQMQVSRSLAKVLRRLRSHIPADEE